MRTQEEHNANVLLSISCPSPEKPSSQILRLKTNLTAWSFSEKRQTLMRKIFEYFFGKYFRTKLCKTAILAKLEKLKKNEGLKKGRNRKF